MAGSISGNLVEHNIGTLFVQETHTLSFHSFPTLIFSEFPLCPDGQLFAVLNRVIKQEWNWKKTKRLSRYISEMVRNCSFCDVKVLLVEERVKREVN